MRFNKQELVTLASHSEHKFQKQGVLILREKSDGFFHRSEDGSSQSKSKSKAKGGAGSKKVLAAVHSDDDDEDDDVDGGHDGEVQQTGATTSHASVNSPPSPSPKKQRSVSASALKKLSRKRSSLSCIGPISSPVSTERWFRLCGNLLFYLKSKDQWSEPVGVIVLENYTVRLDTKTTATYQPTAGSGSSSHHSQQQQVFYFVIDFASGGYHLLGAFSELERTAWMDALRNAGFSMLRNKVNALRAEIQNMVANQQRHGGMAQVLAHTNEDGDEDQPQLASNSNHPRIKHCGYVTDVSESPICEISLACDNLLCDAHGRPPNPKCVVHVRNTATSHSHGAVGGTTPWIKYANTELVEKSSNPTFLTTVYFRASDGLNETTQLRFTVYDVRERLTGIQVVIGQLIISLESLRTIDRIRLPISLSTGSSPGAVVPHIHGGFLTVIVWNLEKEDRYSTESTPCRLTTDAGGVGNGGAMAVGVGSEGQTMAVGGRAGAMGGYHQPQRSTVSNSNYYPNDISSAGVAGTSQTLLYAHRRTQSLPPKLGSKLKLPLQTHFNLLLSHPFVQTYRFHSGLGGDIFVHEILAESKLSFTFPQQLLSVWIAEEKELLQEMIGLGELREPWHSKQVQLLEKHLWLINHYTQARAALMAHKGNDFRPSASKTDLLYEFVPVNLHLQRMWAQNESLHKNGFHDVISVGAFSAMAQGFEQGGLVKLLHAWKQFGETTTKSSRGSHSAWYVTNKVNMTYDSVQGIKRLRKEIVERMQIIMKLAKEKKILGLHRYVEDIYHRCRLLLSICDQSLIEEAFDFLEQQKLTLPNSTSLEFDKILVKEVTAVGPASNQLSIDEGIVDTPTSPIRSVVDLFKKRRNLENAGSGGKGLDDGTPDSGLGLDDIVKSFLDSPSSNYYRPSEEPEPWDLTILNIEASMISLNSKIKTICGTAANIQPHSLRPSNYYQSHRQPPQNLNPPNVAVQRTQSVKNSSSIHFSNTGSPKIINSDNWRKSLREETMLSTVANDSNVVRGELAMVPLSIPRERIVMAPPEQEYEERRVMNTSIDIDSTNVDWSEELRSSIKKLRLAMDGILKTSRLAHCIFRLQENKEKSNLGCTIKYRRDVCFSHALTSLVFGIMTRLWCRKPDPTFLYIITKLGPLACFQGLLSYRGDGAEQMEDMMIAVEDLKTVEFVLVLHESSFVSRKAAAEAAAAAGVQSSIPPPPVLFPLPKVYGSRSSLKVLLPIPDTLLSILPVETGQSRRGNTTSFVVTPVFINIGINGSATIAENLGKVGPQTKSNLDNFTRLNEYYRKYKKLILPMRTATKRNAVTEPSLETLFQQLHTELNSKKKKNVDILHIYGHICRQMMGLRFSSCKSAKDRTAVSVTLEQCQVLSQEYDLAEHEFNLALEAMRAEGCRRENVLKNCGTRKYNFNAVQAFALPAAYRPPTGSYGGGTWAME